MITKATHETFGLSSNTRMMKNWQHTYIADWDTTPMLADVDVGGQLTGWGSYTPNYYLAVKPRNHNYVNDNGTPEDPLDDFLDPLTDWPDPASPTCLARRYRETAPVRRKPWLWDRRCCGITL